MPGFARVARRRRSPALTRGRRRSQAVSRWPSGVQNRRQHLLRAAKQLARVAVRDERLRVLEACPTARGYSLGTLWRRRGVSGLHQIEMADLVNELAAKA